MCESDCWKSGGIWRPRSIPISLSFRGAQTHPLKQKLEKTPKKNAEVKGSLGKSQMSIKDTASPSPRKIVKIYPQLGMWWDIWRSRERNLSSCDQHVFQIRNFTKTHADSPAQIKTCGYAFCTYRYRCAFTIMHGGKRAQCHCFVVLKSHTTN